MVQWKSRVLLNEIFFKSRLVVKYKVMLRKYSSVINAVRLAFERCICVWNRNVETYEVNKMNLLSPFRMLGHSEKCRAVQLPGSGK
jgi:hypothetical protein